MMGAGIRYVIHMHYIQFNTQTNLCKRMVNLTTLSILLTLTNVYGKISIECLNGMNLGLHIAKDGFTTAYEIHFHLYSSPIAIHIQSYSGYIKVEINHMLHTILLQAK